MIPRETDNINQVIIITEKTFWLAEDPRKIDHISQMRTLTVITLSGLHCEIIIYVFLKIKIIPTDSKLFILVRRVPHDRIVRQTNIDIKRSSLKNILKNKNFKKLFIYLKKTVKLLLNPHYNNI
jgi:hypothetical protein